MDRLIRRNAENGSNREWKACEPEELSTIN